jgi:1,4-dihydroxy-2-naphthoyl-CoA hydrolase
MEPRDAAYFNRICQGRLPGFLGIVVSEVEQGRVRLELPVHDQLLAPNGYLHGGTVVALADTAAGYGSLALLGEGESFTTIDLSISFLGTLREGTLVAEARARHVGRTTHIWDVEVLDPTKPKPLALFRCTQLVLRPGAGSGRAR